MWLPILITVLAAYLLGNLNGAVSMSTLLSRKDIRETGSGNAGLTNFLRVYGPLNGLLVVAVDMGKAIIACLMGKLLLEPYGYAEQGLILAALSVSLGHDFPALLGFHGGKGILCGFAVAIVADWRCALIIAVIFGICLALTRYVSLSSVLAALAFCVCFVIFHWQTPFVAVCGVLTGLLAVFMHRGNIARLIKGTERKATFSKFRKQKSQ